MTPTFGPGKWMLLSFQLSAFKISDLPKKPLRSLHFIACGRLPND
jgi:hypothetical protein